MGNTERRERIAESVAPPSYLRAIRDVFFDAIVGDTYFDEYTKRKQKRTIVQPEDLPYLGVYIIDELLTPDGDPSQGMTRFSHSASIGFSVLVAINDQDVAEATIDAAYWKMMNCLWTNAKVTNMFDATTVSNPNNVKIESLTRGVRRHVFGAQLLDNSTPLAELQYYVTVFFRSYWYPWIADDFLRMDVYTRLKQGQLPIRTRYIFEPSGE